MSMPYNVGPEYTGKHRRPGALGPVGWPGRDARPAVSPVVTRPSIAGPSITAPSMSAPWPEAGLPLETASWPEMGTRTDAG